MFTKKNTESPIQLLIIITENAVINIDKCKN